MSGLLRYIILPLCLWWLITGGYETLIPDSTDDSHFKVAAPVPAEPTRERKISRIEPQKDDSDLRVDALIPTEPVRERKIPRIEPQKIVKREYVEPNVESKSTRVPDNPPVSIPKCQRLTSDLMDAETNMSIVQIETIKEWTSCESSQEVKQRLLRYSLVNSRQSKSFETALEISSLYKTILPNDPFPLFEDAETYAVQGLSQQSLESFITGFKMSRSRSEINPRYFMTALKSMQRLGLICEQQQLLTSMLALNQLNAEVKRSIANQIEILNPKCR